VNGLQTSTEVFNYFKAHPEQIDSDNREILVKIIVPTSDDIRDRIIFATNNQTVIGKSSLRATDEIHRQIEWYFKGKNLFYDRRKNYYKNLGKKASEIISLNFLSQLLISVLLQNPNEARARPSTLLTNENRYKKLYNQDLEVFYIIASIGRKIENALKRNDVLTISDVTNIKFYVVYVTFAMILHQVIIKPNDIASLRTDLISDELINKNTTSVLTLYKVLGGDDKVAKGSDLINQLKVALKADFETESDK
jgi:hypothetical protein